MLKVAVTEMSNDATEHIDVASPQEIVEMLSQCDLEMLNGWKNFNSLASSAVHDDILKVSTAVCDVLKHKKGTIILGGCGTSGRIAFMLSKKFNKLLKDLGLNSQFDYVIAGGDKALFTSQEAPEDDPASGKRALSQAMEGKECGLFIGITCGLSAAFIAGQLDYCMDNIELLTPVLLGFNPIINSKNVEIENWDKTFLQVAEKLQKFQQKGQGFIINPILGPEAITGSSRMKGGSATKIILDFVFLTAIQRLLDKPQCQQLNVSALHTMQVIVCEATYQAKHHIASVVKLAADSLNAERHVYYIGAGISGILALIDASECPPTYSSEFDDIRGFLLDGYQSLGNREGNMSNRGEAYCISLQHFNLHIKKGLSELDTVIFILDGNLRNLRKFHEVFEELKYICHVSAICTNGPFQETEYQEFVQKKFSSIVPINIPWDLIMNLFPYDRVNPDDKLLNSALNGGVEFSVKLILNAISTGAHVLKGKVYKHFMVDMKLNNNKLLNRGISIVEKLSECSKEEATEAILKSVYQTDHLPADIYDAKVSQHIHQANKGTKLVPLAIVLANKNCTVNEAKAALNSSKQIRTAIKQAHAAE